MSSKAASFVVALMVLAAGVAAQRASPTRPMALTPLDCVEIRQLVNRAAFALDTGANDGYDYADLFVERGASIHPDASGRDALAALARGARVGPDNTAHYVMNHVIEPTAAGAVGRAYVIDLEWDPPAAGGGRGGGPVNQWDLIGRKAGAVGPMGGHYEDTYVRTPAGWRFETREFVPSQSGPDPVRRRDDQTPSSSRATGAPAAPHAATSFVPPTRQSSLTALDYFEIAQLVSSYGHALDSGYGQGENGEPYANLYTRDAAFAGAEGHDQLVTLAQIQPRGPAYVRHYLTNHVIEPIPGGAKGQEYLVVIDNGEKGRASTLFLGGHYEDTYVKTAEGWRIKTRRLTPPRPGPRRAAPAAAAPGVAAPVIPATATSLPANGKNALTLAAADYADIQQLIARAAYALDSADRQGETYAQLFTADGTFVARTTHPIEIKGRSQLAAYAAGDLAHRGPAYVRDFATNYIVQPSADGATGRVYVVWIEVGEHGNPGVLQGGGHYEDVYVKTGQGWRIKRRTFVPSALGAREVYAPPIAARAQAAVTSARQPMELTALDYIEIQQLVAKYAQYIDTCSNNGYDYADLFAEDGFFAPFRDGQLGPKAQGREALAKVSGGGPNGCTGAGWIRQGVHHLYVNHIITPTPDGASGQVNMLMIGLGGDKNKIEHDGYYEDAYVKTPQGWKFKSRIHHTTWIPPSGPAPSGR